MNTPAAKAEVERLLTRFENTNPAEIVLGLDRIEKALGRLGDPHRNLPPTIHVAGTNGKGSTIAFMRTILAAAGRRVHVYTSPHLVRFNERVVLAGEQISDEKLASVLGRCEAAAGDLPLTYFEAATAAAFLAFAETPADVLLLETGLGGRLDATNVVPDPRACVITPIGLDHQDWLGDSLAEIAFEKAGIIKQGSNLVTGAQRPEVLDVLRNRALALGADQHLLGEDWQLVREGGGFTYEDEHGLSDLKLPRLVGQHQIDNAGLAVAALKKAGLAPDDDFISMGIEAAEWPARFQRLGHGKLTSIVTKHQGDPGELWLDGGHNPHAGRALARTLADLEERSPRPLVLIVGIQKNKDAEEFLAPFEGLASTVLTVKAEHAAAMDAGQLAEAAQRAGLPAKPMDSVEAALTHAVEAFGKSGEGQPRVLICGSLYLAGEVLQKNAE
ncbi:bifunctional folylpolyglutamate synthase/dihydrofolate synthase [Parvularcula sp. ZS-1/3]|uniref:Dihydrofolate synthase/folylpolyglutamate synthase n=1 Tax=Parvularcula mediterranea TaxID=2732508 RepID=A0A7Y3W4J8_9PROT|nr:folylpolyglutamate synthase/dihydrofolate synthase family protein [Parvularcula mediterranea]NNU15830.1 bifunctional folylpolyglutamate synthase/dihydrofolate synthase [Parvularcula mediterranea]